MAEHEQEHVPRADPAAASVVAALEDDPFYRTRASKPLVWGVRQSLIPLANWDYVPEGTRLACGAEGRGQ